LSRDMLHDRRDFVCQAACQAQVEGTMLDVSRATSNVFLAMAKGHEDEL